MADLLSLNPQQRDAARTLHGPVLILAGAGTGKTRVLTARTAWMLKNGIAPEKILAVTFTNKAAKEMRERVARLVPKRTGGKRGKGPAGPTICTFHSLGVRILRRYIERLGYKKNFVIYSESEQLSVVKKILSHISAPGDKTDPYLLLGMLSRERTREGAAAEEGSGLPGRLRQRYESALRAGNAVDFDDLLLLTLRLLEEHADILDACREQYRYVMVDEYQDTNAAQFRLIHLLCQEHRNLCVVGDDDQSIYGWRGAEIANLLDLDRYYPEVKVVTLEQNYRSTNTILEAANAVIRNNARRRGKRLWSENGQGTRITLYAFESDQEEAEQVASQIEFVRLSRRIPWRDQAILFRTNQQSRPLEVALRQAGIRYHLIGGQSFFDRREIRDFMAYLKLFVNPHNDVSLLRIANVPARGLSDATMERLLAASQEMHCPVYKAMTHPDVQGQFHSRTRHAIEAFVTWVEARRAQLDERTDRPSLSQWAESFLKEIDYYQELRRSEKNVEVAENRIRNLKDLIADMESSVDASSGPMEHLQDFLEDLALDGEREADKEPTGDAVTLITMHSCKGLEFPHVYIVGLEDGLLPHTRSKEEGTMDEERRLFYVALTRARQTLTLSHCGSRKKYGQAMPCHPSPFLKELPEHLVESAEAAARKPVNVQAGKGLFSAMREAVPE